MVHINAYPGGEFGTEALGGCCAADDVQTIQIDKFVAAEQFPTAGLKYDLLRNRFRCKEANEFDANGQSVDFLNYQ